MANSLQDQLVKAGLATGAQAKKIERQKRAEDQARRHSEKAAVKGKNKKDVAAEKDRAPKSSGANSVQAKHRAQLAAKASRDKALAQERNKKAQAKAQRAEIKQIILTNDERIKATGDEDVAYNFVHGTKVKRIYVKKEQRDKLVSGTLVVVNNDGLYYFVAKKVADQIAARDPKRIIVANADRTEEPTPDDDYYAKFQVPDDLDW